MDPAPRVRLGAAVSGPWLTVSEGAAYMRMSKTEFRAKVATGEIPSHARSKRSVFVDARVLDEIMRAMPSGAKVPDALRRDKEESQ